MIRMLFCGCLALALVGLVSPSWAVHTGEGDQLLGEEEVAKLPKDAVAQYKLAVISFDHIDRDSGVGYLEEAAKRAPDNIPLQFCLASRARDRARFYYGVRALEYYDKSEEALQRILKQPLLSLEDKRRAEEMMSTIRNEREGQPVKERKMAELGFKAVVVPMAIERAKASGKEITPDTMSKAAGAQGPSSPPMGAAVPGASGTTPAAGALPGSNVPLPSYGVPTERPATPPGQTVPGFSPYGAYPGAYPGAPPGGPASPVI